MDAKPCRLYVQEFRHWTHLIGQEKPPNEMTDFPSLEAAQTIRQDLRIDWSIVLTQQG
jgi:hypothetical protein